MSVQCTRFARFSFQFKFILASGRCCCCYFFIFSRMCLALFFFLTFRLQRMKIACALTNKTTNTHRIFTWNIIRRKQSTKTAHSIVKPWSYVTSTHESLTFRARFDFVLFVFGSLLLFFCLSVCQFSHTCTKSSKDIEWIISNVGCLQFHKIDHEITDYRFTLFFSCGFAFDE